jgi:serine/threonine-protein kinase
LITVEQEGNSRPPEPTATATSDDAYLRAIESASDSPKSPQIRGVAESAVPQPGQMLAGKYRVEGVLGAGGMGVVVAARHVHLDVPVALKFMTEETLADHYLVSRFLHEARATARLRGEHVVRVTDVGELDSGAPYMVMEHLQGQDLGALLASLGTPPVTSAVEYAIQACEGLDEAHRAGIVHRDIKPANLFLTRRPNGTPCIKVLDFGISKAVFMVRPSEAVHSTDTRAVFGTPFYMAPEQMRSARDVDGRSDLWSLGASLYELLSGAPPFPAQSIVDLAYRIANEDPRSLCARRPEIPEGLEQIVFRCLERDPGRRFQSARSLASALEEYRTARTWELPRDAPEDEEMTVIDATRIDAAPMIAIGDSPEMAAGPDSASLTPITQPGPPVVKVQIASEPAGSSRPSGRRLGRLDSARSGFALWAAVVGGAALVLGTVLIARRDPPSAPATEPQPSAAAEALPPATALASVTLVDPPVASVALRTVSVMDLPAVPFPSAAPAPPRVAATTDSTPLPPAPFAAPATSQRAVSPPAVSGVAAAHGSAAAHAPPVSSACTPPYYWDELGLKIFKPECVN